ncbi:MAG: YbaK/EbsC family protein [Planctomycetes bacterium]|nr:YbaK/EbsC family protein [Planctomycetota bacterium]
MKLDAYLTEHGIGYEKHTHRVAYTAQGLADAEHVSGYMVAKPVIVKGGNSFAMCVVAAPKHIDLARVAEVLHEPTVRLATEAEIGELFDDCELGAEPPIGAPFGLKTVMDEQLREDEFLVMQAGKHTEAIKIRRTDWEKLCQPEVASIATA